MKKLIVLAVALLALAAQFPASPAQAHWRGGAPLWGFGAGLLTGYLFAPRPVYTAPPVTVYPQLPRPAYYPANNPYPVYPPVAEAPPYGTYTPPVAQQTPPPAYQKSAVPPPPGSESSCREWKMTERRTERRWDPVSGTWREAPVEKWGWVEIPCNP